MARYSKPSPYTKTMIERMVNKLHVATPEQEIRDMIQNKFGSQMDKVTPGFVKMATQHALKHHSKNWSFYSFVTRGR